MDNNSLIDTVCSRLRPETVPDIRARIEAAITSQFGDEPDPAAVTRFLEDLRLGQSMSGIDIDYAQHYTELYQTGEDFVALVQAIKAADQSFR